MIPAGVLVTLALLVSALLMIVSGYLTIIGGGDVGGGC